MTREPEPETECEPCDEEDGLRFDGERHALESTAEGVEGDPNSSDA